MTYKQLLQTTTWPTISSIFLELYPHAKIDMAEYETVFGKLLLMNPEETDMSIVISREKDDDEEYIEVSGLYNHPKNEEEHYSQGIEFTPWCKWLGMDISTESLADFSELEIIVHCLYEMTYVGFEEEAIQKVIKRLEKDKEDYKSMSEKEKENRFVSAACIEELLKEGRDEAAADDEN